jgi:hypothetical protein
MIWKPSRSRSRCDPLRTGATTVAATNAVLSARVVLRDKSVSTCGWREPCEVVAWRRADRGLLVASILGISLAKLSPAETSVR